ncbi:DNA-binding transcriptional MerR regulator [Paenibacillus rhizosphaerae]|uniref:DNA-binding transcriptional MerR regulator n=1 Tax=Paenibacillus rhizosphaerae TaxID=297318 RepID=A0A839TNS3_9BACL|nr:MerR family transcriptional regulator [Paenibacillus rhizosphaerae]MBB3128415.1 DNA-binding transcriptional MerR regulator [Paenibacillus rhizosphaerae]
MNEEFTIGQVAEKTGLPIHTIRYYEKEGILPFIKRNESGRRIFEYEDIQWINLLNCLRDTGMPIAQLKDYADLTLQGDPTGEKRLEILKKQKEKIEEQVNILKSHIELLNLKMEWYPRLKKENIQFDHAVKAWLKDGKLPPEQ